MQFIWMWVWEEGSVQQSNQCHDKVVLLVGTGFIDKIKLYISTYVNVIIFPRICKNRNPES